MPRTRAGGKVLLRMANERVIPTTLAPARDAWSGQPLFFFGGERAMTLKIDLHGYHPSEIDIPDLLRQAWEMGAPAVKLVHGHGRHRGIPRGFFNTNTGYFGRCVRKAIRGNAALKPWVKISTLDCGEWGETRVKLKPNPNPTRTGIELPEKTGGKRRDSNNVRNAMNHNGERLAAAIAAIDAANGRDPNRIEVEGKAEPAELVYGRRMSETLARLAPDASEHLRIAARGQHIERWTSPRKGYPEGRAGYLKWRKDLKDFHAERVAAIMTAAGYDATDIARVGALIRKEQLKRDPEAQLLEDVVCVVFLEHYIDGFMAKTDEGKLADILAKTWRKMSPLGHEHALKLPLPPAVPRLLEQGLSRQDER